MSCDDHAANQPLLENKQAPNGTWLNEVIDVDEAKDQMLFALPMILTNMAYYLIPLISVMFAGHLGEHELAASNLANSWASVSGLALMTQCVVLPLVVCSLVPLALHVGIAYALVNWTSLGYVGAPLAASISLWISVLMLALYVLKAKKFEKTWNGFTPESFGHIFSNLKLALPSAAMVCLEFWAFEVLVLLAGLMPNSEISTSLIAMCVSMEGICYMVAYGLSAAASTRVSNELGAGRPKQAKCAMAVTLKLTTVMALCAVLALYFGHNGWAGSFSDSPVIIDAFATMTPWLVLSITFDFVQGILSGVARGCGWQRAAMLVNLGTFYCVGMPIAVLLGFRFKLYAKGLWIGLICGLSVQTIGLLLLTNLTKWSRIETSNDSNANIKEDV